MPVVTERRDWLVDRFEQHRAHLHAVAYRMLGSVTEAEDAVQEAWLRACQADLSRVENAEQWLTTIVGRVCLNILRARSRPEDPAAHVPDLVVTLDEALDPQHEALLADSVGPALLVARGRVGSPARRPRGGDPHSDILQAAPVRDSGTGQRRCRSRGGAARAGAR